ncbi:MAG: hypothetical protein KY463_06260, partial [Actinobacteria bacterium]|nr:hypothetical protein [Actinomycetota bacterium]
PALVADYAREVPSYGDGWGGPRPAAPRVLAGAAPVPDPAWTVSPADRVLLAVSLHDPAGLGAVTGAPVAVGEEEDRHLRRVGILADLLGDDAETLARFAGARGLDVFVRDVGRETTVIANVSSRGRLRGRERAAPPPTRPSLSADGATAAFASSASNYVRGDTNRVADVFLRRLTPAASATAVRRVGLVDGRLLIVFRSHDRSPSPLQCRLDRGEPTLCPLGGLLLPKLSRGRHVLHALAGAPGAHYARRPIVIRMTIGKGRPRVRVQNPGDRL